VVVPFAAGGNTDMMARLGAQHLSAKFGQSFVVEPAQAARSVPGSWRLRRPMVTPSCSPPPR